MDWHLYRYIRKGESQSMIANIRPKTAAKHLRRQSQQFAEGQLQKIAAHLRGFIEQGETVAQAVKRLTEALKTQTKHKSSTVDQ